MRIKNKRNIYAFLIFTFIIFEFSVVFLFSNVNSLNPFSNRILNYEENRDNELRTSSEASLLWSYSTGAHIYSSPALGDLDGDGKLEVVIGSHDWKIYALNGENGGLLWSFSTGGMVISSPALGDLDGDGRLEVVVGSEDGKIYALNGENGGLLWNFPSISVESSPALGDVDDDGRLEVVVGSDGNLYALNGEDGTLLWSYSTGCYIYSSPALGDVDGDGRLEAVVGGTDGKLYALNGEDGNLLWSFTIGGYVQSSPALGDLDGDGMLEAVIGNDAGKLYALNGEDGSVQWSYSTGGYIHSSPALGDIDGDEQFEVVVGSDEMLYALDGEVGIVQWSYSTGYFIISSPALGDLDGDGKLEVVNGNNRIDNIYALNGEDGTLQWSYSTGDYITASSALGDIDGDGKLEVVTGCYNNKVYAIKPTPSGENIAWQGFSGDLSFYRTKCIPISGISITILSPDNKSSWETGISHKITWTSIGPISDVKIELYKNNEFVMEIVATTPNDGSYTWINPSGLEDSTQYQVKIINVLNVAFFDISNNFKIFNSITDNIYTIANVTSHLWSPDGTKLAYIKNPYLKQWNCELWVADKDPFSSELINHVLISSEVEYNGLLDWKDDWILYKIRREEGTPISYYGRNELWKIRYNGTSMTQITFSNTNGIRTSSATWPNTGTVLWGKFIPGTDLVYFHAHNGNGYYRTFVCNDDGTDEWYQISYPDWTWRPAMSPTGNKLLWGAQSNFGQPTTLKSCNVDGSDRVTIKAFSNVIGVNVLADGNTVVWSDAGNLYAINIDGTDERTILEDTNTNIVFSYNPSDPQGLLIASNRSDGNNHVFKINVDGSEIEQLTEGPYIDEYAFLSPDGQSLSYLRLPYDFDKESSSMPYPYELVVSDYNLFPNNKVLFDQYSIANVIVNHTFNEDNKLLFTTGFGNYLNPCNDLVLDSAGSLYLTGKYIYGGMSADIGIAKYGNSGNLIWFKNWYSSSKSYEWGNAIDLDPAGNIIVAGVYGTMGAQASFILVKFDQNGNQKWVFYPNYLNIGGGFIPTSVKADPVGNIYVAGYKDTALGLAKIDSGGNFQWFKTWGEDNERANSLALDSQGYIYLGGSQGSIYSGVRDFCLVKFSNSGDLVWSRLWGGLGDEEGTSVMIDSSDYIYIVGSNHTGGNSLCFLKYNSAGTLEWEKIISETFSATTFDIALDSIENFYVVGSNKVVKFNQIGDYEWQKEMSGSYNKIALDAAGNIFLVGGNLARYKPIVGCPINFSIRQNHVLTEGKIVVKLSNFINVKENNFIKVETTDNELIQQINLPFSEYPVDYEFLISINLNKLQKTNHLDGATYESYFFIYNTLELSYSVNSIELYLEEKAILNGFLTYNNQYGFIDIGLDASTYRETPWVANQLELFLPEYSELNDFYGTQEEIYLDQFWTINRIEFPYLGVSYELNLPYGIYTHILYINDTDLSNNDKLNESLNRFTYRITFDKKPLAMALYIQNPDLELVKELVITDPADYSDNALYCKIYDPTPVDGVTEIPYFMNQSKYNPLVNYYIGSSITSDGTFSFEGINTHEFIWILEAGLYDLTAILENVVEPFYNTMLENSTQFKIVQQPHFDISYDSDTVYMGDSLEFTINLLSPNGLEIGQNISVLAEKSSWDSLDSTMMNLDVLANYSGNYYNFVEGIPSASALLANGQPTYSLLNASYPSNGLIFTPEILEYNPETKYSRQQLEVYIVLDISKLIENYNLNPREDFSFLKATIFGSSFIDSLQQLEDTKEYYGKIEIYNSHLDVYETLKSYNIFTETLDESDPYNLLRLDDISNYKLKKNWEDEIWRYIDTQSRITFRLISYFEGNVSNSNTYLSQFDKQNAVLGALIDHVEFDLAWWKNTPNLVDYIQSPIPSKRSPTTFNYYPTAPGTYNITFEYFNSSSFYHYIQETIEITVERRPVNIDLKVISDGYSTGTTALKAIVIDQKLGIPAIDAKVRFYTSHEGEIIIIGEALTDTEGLATITTTNLALGGHMIWAETIPNSGKHLRPFINEYYDGDKWALNSSVMHPLHISLSQSKLELISLAPEGANLIVNQSFYLYPKLIDTYTGKEIFNEPIEIFINSETYGTYYSSVPILISFNKPGDFVIEGFYNGTSVLSDSNASVTFTVQRLSLYFSEVPQNILYPNQLIYITVTAYDLTTETNVNDLAVYLYNNLSSFVELAYTNNDGTVTFTFTIPKNWAGKDVHFFALNSEINGKYLERRTENFSTSVRPYNCSIFLTISENNLYVNNSYYYTFELWNEDLKELVDNENILIDILKDNVPISSYHIITAFNNILELKFLTIGEYEIVAKHDETVLYMYNINTFVIEIIKRPTCITVKLTDQDLVPGNEFSITVFLNDALTNKSILYKKLNVSEFIYKNGKLVDAKDQFEVYIPVSNTFHWQPLREADFMFTFSYDELNDPIYQNSNYSIILDVRKRQVQIISEINGSQFKVGDFIQINSSFTDLNTTNWDPIVNLVVNFMIQHENTILYSQNLTTNGQGLINFNWQIPLGLVNTKFNITICTANTNFYQWNYKVFEISTLALDTYFNVTSTPNPRNYIGEETVFNIELLSILGESVKETISYEIVCSDISYYNSGDINLEETSLLSIALPEIGKYEISFFYDGSEYYAPAQFKLTYYIILRPVSLELVEGPEFLYYNQQTVNLTYRLSDASTQTQIANCLIHLYYIDFDTNSKINLDLQQLTDINGEVHFIVTLPLDYNYDTLIILAESSETTLNGAGTNSFEFSFTDSPTYINLNSGSDSLTYYVGESLNITFELFDYYDKLLLSQLLSVDIETPFENISMILKSNDTIDLLFPEAGIYKINVNYPGNVSLLPSSSQIYYFVSLIPTTLEFTDPIPGIVFTDQNIFLSTQLKNNLTKSPIEGENVKFYITNGILTSLIYEGVTDNNGILSYVWEIDPVYFDQNVIIYAYYNFTQTYQNCSSPEVKTSISRYNVELEIIEFPEMLYPLTETSFTFIAYKHESGEVASKCNLQLFLVFPNNSRTLLYSGPTDDNGLLSFDWTPDRYIFNFNELIFEVNLIEDDTYYSGVVFSSELIIDKIPTTVSILPSKYFVLPYENIPIEFDLVSIYGQSLYGHTLNVEIRNVLFSTNFTVIIGVNDTYNFIVPNYGAFEISGTFEGNDRYYSGSNITLIYSEKFELLIELSIYNAFTKNQTDGFLGELWDYSIFDDNQNFTLVANVSIREYNIPMNNVEVLFYFIVKNQNPILIGSNFTNKEGIATLLWDTSNYSLSKSGIPRALQAKIEETNYNYAAESNPVYFTLRKIHTYIELDTFTPLFRIDVNYVVNITLYDEFTNKLDGCNLTAEIYFKGKIVESFTFITNKTSQIYFTPTQRGIYKIKVYFSGTEVYKASQETKTYNSVEEEPTALKILLPKYIQPGQLYDLKILLLNSTGGLLSGERVDIKLIYHDDSGVTEIFDLYVIIGENNTFIWTFPDYDEYVLKATYLGSDDYLGCKEISKAENAKLSTVSFFELLIMLSPCLMIIPSRDKTKPQKSSWKKKKKMFAVLGIIFATLGANYVNIAYVCSQIETTGLIKDFDVKSNFKGENDLYPQTQDTMSDMFDYSNSLLNNIELDSIPDLENNSAPYDIIVQDSTEIPPELDKTPPDLGFTKITDGTTLTNVVEIDVVASDRESGIKNIIFKLFNQSLDIILEGNFTYNISLDIYSYTLNTSHYLDGEYTIYANAIDYNNNEKSITSSIRIANNPVSIPDEVKLDFVLVEMTDDLNVSFGSLSNGNYVVKIYNVNHKTIMSFVGLIKEHESKTLSIPIEPLYFKIGDYKVEVSINAYISGIKRTETQEMYVKVVKESVKLELDVVEKDDIYTQHSIILRARLIENDVILDHQGLPYYHKYALPIKGQVLDFEIADKDNYQFLGSAITDNNGNATFYYKVDLSKGWHVFNVTYKGNNIYKSLETFKMFDNQGKLTQILLSDEIKSVPYNTIGEINACLKSDNDVIPGRAIYFNISNSYENIYIGMAKTDFNGMANISFPCNHLPGNYDVIITFDGDSIYSNNIVEFPNAFEILRESTKIKIINAETNILCPLNYETEIAALLVINETHVGIEGIPLTFELIYNNIYFEIGSPTTDTNGLASILFEPSDFNLVPGGYELKISLEGDEFYEGIASHAALQIKKDIPVISIKSTEAYFLDAFQINATLTDSLLTPLNGKLLDFYLIDPTMDSSIYVGSTLTNEQGIAILNVPANKINVSGVFSIGVQFSGDNFEEYMYKVVNNALIIHLRETHLCIQGPDEQIPTENLKLKLILTDNMGTSIGGQKIYLECYKKGSKVNLLGSKTSILTNASGIALYTLPLFLQGNYRLYAYYNPQSDDLINNDGFLDSKAEFNFKIVSIPADLSLGDISLPRIMRGDVLDVTIVSASKEAKNYIIPIRIYLDSKNFNHTDILGLMFLYNGIAKLSYKIPYSTDFQAGIYNFTVEIQPGSLFEGSFTFSMDLVERTTLLIKYDILNKLAEGKHYIGEAENITFTLYDEDGMPLPYTCENELVNRWISYQIINGKNIYGLEKVGLLNGSFLIIYKPDSYGLEISSAFNNGSRFFAPCQQKNIVEVFKRPLLLQFIDFTHNNQSRLDFPHLAHRGETLIIHGRVQDYLNKSYLPNQKVFFGFDGNYFEISSTSNENGYVELLVPLTNEIGLIQAGEYKLFMKIKLTEKFQSIINTTSNLLSLFEIGSFKCNIAPIIFENMNYILKPTLYFYDEDDQLVRESQFYIRVVNTRNNEKITERFIENGRTRIPVSSGGEYRIELTINDELYAVSNNPYDIITNLNSTLLLAPIAITYVLIFDPFIFNIAIPLFSDLITLMFPQSIEWGADLYTVLILTILYFIFGYRTIELTWGELIRFIILMVTLKVINWDNKFYRYSAILGVFVALASFIDVFRQPNWYWKIINLLIVVTATSFVLANSEIDKLKGGKGEVKNPAPDVLIIFMEMSILFFWAVNRLLTKVLVGLLSVFTIIADFVIEGLWQTKNLLKDDMDKYDKMKNGYSLMFIFLISFTIKEKIINPIVLWLIPKGGWLEFIKAVIRNALELALTLVIMAALAWVLGVITTFISEIIGVIVKKLVDSILKAVFELILNYALGIPIK